MDLRQSSNVSRYQSSASMIDVPITDSVFQKKLFAEIQHLNAERQRLLIKIKTLEGLRNNFPMFSEENKPDADDTFDGEMYALFELPSRIYELDKDIHNLKHRINAMEEKRAISYGKKTMRRIDRLKELLNEYGGSQDFKQLQVDLGLSPSQFTRLVGCLDEQSFEVRLRPDAKRGEKMLILK